MTQQNAWRLVRRPEGEIADSDLELITSKLPALSEGEISVAVEYISVDATNRIWMSDADQYMPPVALGDIMRAGVAGKVIASRHPKFKEGMTVGGLGGYASHVVAPGNFFSPIPEVPGVPLTTLFGSLGGTALTAYFGLLKIGDPKPGETLVVSAAAGAVGSMVGQIGKIQGCRVIGIAGGAEKCAYVTQTLGFDGCADHKASDLGAQLDALCPDGIDINFENVGGDIMELVMQRMTNFSRMPLCGMISMYDHLEEIQGPKSWSKILMNRIRVQGFIVSDFLGDFPAASAQLIEWAQAGKLKTREDIRPGLENALDTLRDLYKGGNNGKLLIKV